MTDPINQSAANEQAQTQAEDATPAVNAPFIAPAEQPAQPSKKKGWLSKAFSIALTAGAGIGVGIAIKTCAITALCTAGAPATLAAVTACAATGFVIGAGKTLWRHQKARKNGSTESFWSKKNAKTVLFNTAVATAAGSFVLAFGDEIADIGGGIFDKISGLFNGPDVNPPVDVPPVVTSPIDTPPEMSGPADADLPPTAPVPEPEPVSETPVTPPEVVAVIPSALDKAAEQAAESKISALGQQTLERAQAGNAQAIKDLGYFIFNGFQGFSENQELGVELFGQASELGNVQAKVDLAYAGYYGFGDVETNPEGAYEAMQGLAAEDRRAAQFVETWDKIRPAAFTATPAP